MGPDGTVYVIDRGNGRVRSIGADGAIETVAGNGEESPPPKEVAGPAPGDGQLATEVPLPAPATAGSDGVAAGQDGSIYLCGGDSHRLFRVSPLGVITTFAGTGERAYAGDGALAIDAALAEPADVAVGPDGSVYVADYGNDRVRRVRPDGTIIAVAELSGPVAVDVAQDGTVYAVAGGQTWRIDTSGTISRVTPYAGDVTDPDDVAVGPDGLLYLASGAQVLVIRDNGTTRPVVGTGDAGDPIDGIALDRAGNLYLSHAAANQVTVVVRATDDGADLPWHWLILALVAATTVAAAAVSVRAGRAEAAARR